MLNQRPRSQATVSRFPVERPIFLALLNEQLECRAREHGHAWVTSREAAWLEAHDLRQSGHTTYRYSTFDEDRSDAALARQRTAASRRRQARSTIPS